MVFSYLSEIMIKPCFGLLTLFLLAFALTTLSEALPLEDEVSTFFHLPSIVRKPLDVVVIVHYHRCEQCLWEYRYYLFVCCKTCFLTLVWEGVTENSHTGIPRIVFISLLSCPIMRVRGQCPHTYSSTLVSLVVGVPLDQFLMKTCAKSTM